MTVLLLFHRAALAGIGIGPACPKVGTEWEELRTDIVKKAGWVEDSSGDLELLGECLPRAPKKIQACMGRTLEYLQHRSHFADIGLAGSEDKDGRTLGHTISDDAYFEKTKTIDPYPDVFNTEAFLKVMQVVPLDLEKIEKEIAALNSDRQKRAAQPIEWLNYRSIQPANDNSGVLDRILLYVPPEPGDALPTERWIQFAPGSTLLNTITLVENGGKKRGYFKDLRSSSEKDQKLSVHFEAKNLGSDSCTKCHISSGPFPIYPKDPVAARFQEALKKMNERIGNYGVTRNEFEPIRPKAWPHLGDSNPLSEAVKKICITEPLKREFQERSDGPFERRVQVTVDKIQASMQCATCHNDQDRGALTPPIRTWKPGVFHSVQSGKMPPDNNLSPAEARMLADCLNRTYFGYTDKYNQYQPGAFAEYLVAEPCTIQTTKDSPTGLDSRDEEHDP